MLKDLILKVFKGMGILVASAIIWEIVIGWYDTNTNIAGVYPSYFNKSIYENSLPIVSHRMYIETDLSGAGYTERTYNAYVVPVRNNGVELYTTKGMG